MLKYKNLILVYFFYFSISLQWGCDALAQETVQFETVMTELEKCEKISQNVYARLQGICFSRTKATEDNFSGSLNDSIFDDEINYKGQANIFFRKDSLQRLDCCFGIGKQIVSDLGTRSLDDIIQKDAQLNVLYCTSREGAYSFLVGYHPQETREDYDTFKQNQHGDLEKFSGTEAEEKVEMPINIFFMQISSSFMYGGKFKVSDLLQLGEPTIASEMSSGERIWRCELEISNSKLDERLSGTTQYNIQIAPDKNCSIKRLTMTTTFPDQKRVSRMTLENDLISIRGAFFPKYYKQETCNTIYNDKGENLKSYNIKSRANIFYDETLPQDKNFTVDSFLEYGIDAGFSNQTKQELTNENQYLQGKKYFDLSSFSSRHLFLRLTLATLGLLLIVYAIYVKFWRKVIP